jgi:SAM-dependent methyltransferase
MTDITDVSVIVRDHYQAGVTDEHELIKKVIAVVDGMGQEPLTAARLAGLDQFHVGGLAATAELANRVNIQAGMKVLDAGSGLGGPARYLAETFDCQVIGVDLAPYYVSIAQILSARSGLKDLVSFQVGDLTALPFQAGAFNLVWTQHVVMNISDRDRLYREFRRVLAPRGNLAFYDVLAADGKSPPYYPVPWSESAATSVLLTEDETIASIEAAGFELTRWNDVSEVAMGWMSQQQQSPAPLPGPGLVVGPRIGEMVVNFRKNLMEGRVKLVMGVAAAVYQ